MILLNFFEKHDYLPRNGKFCNYVINKYPFVLIGLDTTVLGKSHGEFCNERLQWLDINLKRYLRKPTLLFMHHPPFLTGVEGMDNQNLKNSSKFFEILKCFLIYDSWFFKNKFTHNGDNSEYKELK